MSQNADHQLIQDFRLPHFVVSFLYGWTAHCRRFGTFDPALEREPPRRLRFYVRLLYHRTRKNSIPAACCKKNAVDVYKRQCPAGAISQGDEHFEINADTCMDCGACCDSCPNDAIHPAD